MASALRVMALARGLTLLQDNNKSLITWAVNIGRIDLAIAAIWLVVSRLGVRLQEIREPIVLLTAVHFHYTGFAAALVTGTLLAHVRRAGRHQPFLNTIVTLIIVTPFMVAIGFVWSATLKMVAAVVLSASLAALAGSQFWFCGKLSSLAARIYIRLSALSVVVGMALAMTYAIGDWLKQDWLVIPRMASTHGLLNGLGFSLLALLGWLIESRFHPSQKFANG